MKKLLKISLVLVIIAAFAMNFSVFAVENNEAAEEATTTTTTTTANEAATPNNSSSNKSSTQVTSVNSVDDKELSISDILNILLIATGVVIILLAIAIFIKLK